MEEAKQATHAAITIEQAEALRKYLGSQPYDEAFAHIRALAGALPITATPKAVKEPGPNEASNEPPEGELKEAG